MKPLYYTLFFIASLLAINTDFVSAQALQGSYLDFKNESDLPYLSEWPATVADGTNIYAINGYTPNYTGYRYGYSADILSFDKQGSKWTFFSRKAGQKIQSAAAYMASDCHIYIFGGAYLGSNRIYGDVQSFDLNSGEIKNLGVLNPISAVSGCAAEWDSKIYLFGGTRAGNQTTNNLYSFDPQNLQFIKLANMPERLQTTGAILDGILYTFGGYNSSKGIQSASINAYDIKTDTWATIGELPKTISANSVVVCGSLVFIIGDYNEENFLGYYNTRTHEFVKLRSNMTGHRAGGAAIINNTLYVFGGKTDKARVTGGFKNMQSADVSAILRLEAGK